MKKIGITILAAFGIAVIGSMITYGIEEVQK